MTSSTTSTTTSKRSYSVSTTTNTIPDITASLSLGPAPKVRRLVTVPMIVKPLPIRNNTTITIDTSTTAATSSTSSSDDTVVVEKLSMLITNWQQTQQQFPFHTLTSPSTIDATKTTTVDSTGLQQIFMDIFIQGKQHPSIVSTTTSFGSCALQRLGAIIVEQDRLKSQYVQDVVRLLHKTIHIKYSGNYDHHNNNYHNNNNNCSAVMTTLTSAVTVLRQLQQCASKLCEITKQYQSSVQEILQRQQLEFTAACHTDHMYAHKQYHVNDITKRVATTTLSCGSMKVGFRHSDVFSSAQSLYSQLCSNL